MGICGLELVHIGLGDDDTKDVSLRLSFKYENNYYETSSDGTSDNYNVTGLNIQIILMDPAKPDQELKLLKEVVIPRTLIDVDMVNAGKFTKSDISTGITVDLVDTGFNYSDYDYPDTTAEGYDPDDETTWSLFQLTGVEKIKVVIRPVNIDEGLPANGKIWNVSNPEDYAPNALTEMLGIEKWTPEEYENSLDVLEAAALFFTQAKILALTTWGPFPPLPPLGAISPYSAAGKANVGNAENPLCV